MDKWRCDTWISECATCISIGIGIRVVTINQRNTRYGAKHTEKRIETQAQRNDVLWISQVAK